MRFRNIGGMAVAFALVIFLYAWRSSVTIAQTTKWTDNGQCAMPSGSTACQVGAPISTSLTTETKTGPLNFKNGLTISNPNAGTCNGDQTVVCSGTTQSAANKVCTDSSAGSVCLADANLYITGTFIWNGTAPVVTWSDVAGASGTFVPLHGEAYDPDVFPYDQGYVSIKGLAATQNRTSAFKVRAGLPVIGDPSAVPPTTTTPTSAIVAYDNSSTFPSYAVVARTGAAGDNNMAFYGYTPANAKNAWAGYFRGNVVAKASAGPKKWDLVIGGTAAPNDNGVAELCLQDVCFSSWPSDLAGDDLWFDSSGYLQVKDPTWDFAVGGDSSGAPFAVTPVPAQSVVNLINRGFGKSSTLIIQ